MKQHFKQSLILLALVAFAASPLMAQAWAGKGRAFGVVRDEAGQPVEGAKITLFRPGQPDQGPEPIQTNAKGRFMMGGLGHGAWTFFVDLEGYKGVEGSFAVNEFGGGQEVKITLIADAFGSIAEADTLLDAGKHAEARAVYESAIKHLDVAQAARLRSRIGDTYLAEGNLDAAREQYEKSLGFIPPEEQSHVRLQLAKLHQQQNNIPAAIAEYEKVLPVLTDDGKAQILVSIARLHDQTGNRDAALANLERGLEVSPDNTQLLQVIADLLTREGREAEAQEYLARLPDDAEVPSDLVLNVGIRLYNEGKIDEAYEFFDRAVKENPNVAEAYYYRGLVLVGKGENEPAIGDFNKLLELDPNSVHKDEVLEFLKYLTAEG